MLDRTNYRRSAAAALAALFLTVASFGVAVSPAVPMQTASATGASASAASPEQADA